MKLLVIFFAMFVSLQASAEVYRYTDANGKIHYSDKPVPKAENITDSVKKTNVDTSPQEQQKVGAIFRKENDADRAFQQQQARAPEISPEKQKACNEAKDLLHKVSGRVAMIDENGKPVKYTDQQRKADAETLQKAVQENCTQ